MNHQKELFIMLTCTSTLIPIAYGVWLQDKFTDQLQKKHKNVLVDLISNYKVAFKDTAFVKVVTGSTFIFAAEFSLNSYIGIRLAETFEAVRIGSFEIVGVRMLSILNIENMLLVVCFTFIINRFTDKMNKKNALITGLIIYGIGYVTVTSANTWYMLVLFNLIATMGELIYSPIRNAEQSNMIPIDKRGSYSAFSNLSFSGADLIARASIIIGAFLIPTMMSVYIGFIVMMGTILIYTGLFAKTIKVNNLVNKGVSGD